MQGTKTEAVAASPLRGSAGADESDGRLFRDTMERIRERAAASGVDVRELAEDAVALWPFSRGRACVFQAEAVVRCLLGELKRSRDEAEAGGDAAGADASRAAVARLLEEESERMEAVPSPARELARRLRKSRPAFLLPAWTGGAR